MSWGAGPPGALLLAAGLLVAAPGAPANAAPAPPASPVPEPGGPAAVSEAAALGLLGRAVWAQQNRSYRGTEYVTTQYPTAPYRTARGFGSGGYARMLDVGHTVGTGLAVWDPEGSGGAVLVPGEAFDGRLLRMLAAHYVLRPEPDQLWLGRPARVVAALPLDGSGTAAGRFWVDEESGLLVRREVYDARGQRVRTSALVALSLVPPRTAAGQPRQAGTSLAPAGEQLDGAELSGLRAEGWPIPATLPGGLDLFDARLRPVHRSAVLQLAYCDGLSTLSLFVQPGRLGSRAVPGFLRGRIGRRAVWVSPGLPTRVVFSGGGRVWTVVSDASADTVSRAVSGLPADPADGTGLWCRLRRGVGRIARWLDPFG